MRLRDAVKYALYVSRAVGEPGGAHSSHRFGAVPKVLRAKFLDVIQKLMYHGYTEAKGHTRDLMNLIMTSPHTPTEVWKQDATTGGKRRQSDVDSAARAIKQFWVAMKGSSDTALNDKIKEILRKLYEKAVGSNDFDAKYESCVTGAVAVASRERKKPALRVRRVQDEDSAFAYAARDAIDLKASVDMIVQSSVTGTSAVLMDDLEKGKGEISEVTRKYIERLSFAVTDYTVVVSTGHEVKEEAHNMYVRRCSVTVHKKDGTESRTIRTLDLGLLGGAMTAHEKESEFGTKLRDLLNDDNVDKRMRGLGSVVVFLVIGGRRPGRFTSYARGNSFPSMCVFFYAGGDIQHHFRGLLDEGILLAGRATGALPVNDRATCKQRRPDPPDGSSTRVQTDAGNVVIDPFRRTGAGGQIAATTAGAAQLKAALDAATPQVRAIFYNHETYSRARTYAPGVITGSGAVAVPEDGTAGDYAALARCAVLSGRVLQLVDATALPTGSVREEAWLGVLVAMACNPRIMLVVTDEQHDIIADEVERANVLQPLPNVGARPPSSKPQSGAKKPRAADPDESDGAEESLHVTRYADLVSDAVHDSCVLARKVGRRTASVVIGPEGFDAIMRESDITDPKKQLSALQSFLLACVEGPNERGTAKPVVLSCRAFVSAEPNHKAVSYEYAEGETDKVIKEEIELGTEAATTEGLAQEKHTHAVFVVDFAKVPNWREAEAFWKSEHGLNFKAATECVWVTVLVARSRVHTPLNPPSSAVIVGTVQLATAIVDATSFTCEAKKQDRLERVRTFDSSLKVTNAVRVVVDESDLQSHHSCSLLTVYVNGVETTGPQVPITVLDVADIEVTRKNVGALIDIGMARNYILLTTPEQSKKINKGARARVQRREADKNKRLAKKEEERRRAFEDAETETAESEIEDIYHDLMPYEVAALGEPKRPVRSQITFNEKHSERNDISRRLDKMKLRNMARRNRMLTKNLGKSKEWLQELWKKKRKMVEGTRPSTAKEREAVSARAVDIVTGQGASAGSMDEGELPRLGEIGSLDVDDFAFQNPGQSAPVFGSPVRILGELYEVSETGCDEMQCQPKDDIVKLLDRAKTEKLKFLLVRRSDARIKASNHHVSSLTLGPKYVYLKCAEDGTVVAEEAWKTPTTSTVKRLEGESLRKAIEAIANGTRGAIYVLCTS